MNAYVRGEVDWEDDVDVGSSGQFGDGGADALLNVALGLAAVHRDEYAVTSIRSSGVSLDAGGDRQGSVDDGIAGHMDGRGGDALAQ